jgi:Ribbon-helix-helix protein, copG family
VHAKRPRLPIAIIPYLRNHTVSPSLRKDGVNVHPDCHVLVSAGRQLWRTPNIELRIQVGDHNGCVVVLYTHYQPMRPIGLIPWNAHGDTDAKVTDGQSRTEVLSVRIPTQLMDALEVAAAAAGQSISEFVRATIESRLRGMTPFTGSVLNQSISYGTFQATNLQVWNEPSGAADEQQHTIDAVPRS